MTVRCGARLTTDVVGDGDVQTYTCSQPIGHYDEGGPPQPDDGHAGWHMDDDNEVRWSDAAEGAVASPIPLMSDEKVAQLFHEVYETQAALHGYKTREETAVPWDEVPEPNRSLMVHVAGEVAAAVRREVREREAGP